MGLRSGVVRGNCGRTSAFRFKVVGIFERGCSEIRKPLHNATEKDFHFQTGFELRSRRGLREGGFQSAAVAVRIQFRVCLLYTSGRECPALSKNPSAYA